MQRPRDGPRNLLVGLAKLDQDRFQFSREARSLQTLLVEVGLQVRPLRVRSRVLITFLPVFAGFDEVFDYAQSIFFIHEITSAVWMRGYGRGLAGFCIARA